ncbi:hypothetical protein [Winogradskya consettensis]|uniref:hypothetical protein n=1 Tax=Winogradskya consettensis TaxID=113560 RepID=UPI001BB3FB23|nr:hypothetical protein [Actinoplanes consettensis]
MPRQANREQRPEVKPEQQHEAPRQAIQAQRPAAYQKSAAEPNQEARGPDRRQVPRPDQPQVP